MNGSYFHLPILDAYDHLNLRTTVPTVVGFPFKFSGFMVIYLCSIKYLIPLNIFQLDHIFSGVYAYFFYHYSLDMRLAGIIDYMNINQKKFHKVLLLIHNFNFSNSYYYREVIVIISNKFENISSF